MCCVECLCCGVEVEVVVCFVLYFCYEDCFVFEVGCLGDLVVFWLYVDDFGVGVLGDLLYECLVVGVGYLVVGFDVLFVCDEFVE